MHSHAPAPLLPIDADLDLARVVGGANLDFAAIRQQAQAYCPATTARYGNINPASVNRPVALKMGNECLAEMGPLKAAFARGPIQSAINSAFPR
jgi:hypothetical protein